LTNIFCRRDFRIVFVELYFHWRQGPKGGGGGARGRRKEGGAKDCESNIKASNKYYIGSRGLLPRLLNVYPVYLKKKKKKKPV
jgi:hypothetical protein